MTDQDSKLTAKSAIQRPKTLITLTRTKRRAERRIHQKSNKTIRVHVVLSDPESSDSRAYVIERLKAHDLLLAFDDWAEEETAPSEAEIAALADRLTQGDSLSQWIIDSRDDRL
jgi:hypothetical protein